jgi:hypothetical protein
MADVETNYEKALRTALDNAFSSLQEKDLKERAFKSGAALEKEGILKTNFLHHTVQIAVTEGRVLVDGVEAGIRLSILLLHYLLQASGVPLTGRMISFKEVPQGALYFQPFRGRVVFPMLGFPDGDPQQTMVCVQQLGGEHTKEGDLSFRLRPLPYVMVQYIFHRGEEGIPPDLTVLFDASVSEYLSTEDIVVLCEEVNRNLKDCVRNNASVS